MLLFQYLMLCVKRKEREGSLDIQIGFSDERTLSVTGLFEWGKWGE